jgi:predicted nucleic acid-binding Zn finger protein
VVRGDDDRVVRVDPAGYTCSCPWWAKHGGSRGPCKHVLAVHVARSRQP